jgi:hypothetical protein
MWVSGSRTALLVYLIGVGALLIAEAQHRQLWQPRAVRFAALIGVLAFVLAAAVIPRDFESTNPLQRAFARVPPLEAGEIKRFATELWVRFGYGRAADHMVLEQPISGVGVGAFHVLAPEYIYRDTGRRVAPDNAQNWWRHQLAELGVLGAIPPLWASVLVFRLCRRGNREHQRRTATALRGTLLGLGAASLLGVPTQSPAIAISFGTLLFWLTAAVARDAAGATAARTSDRRPRLAAAVLWAVTVIGSLTLSSFGELRVPSRAVRAGVPYAYGVTPPQEVSAFGGVRWMATRAVWVMSAENRWLRLTVWAPHADPAQRPIAFSIRANQSASVAREITTAEPESFYVEAADAAQVMLELAADREVAPNRALQLAATWHGEPPAGVAADALLR